jgi:P4 family phage/plasmid primase-like protien
MSQNAKPIDDGILIRPNFDDIPEDIQAGKCLLWVNTDPKGDGELAKVPTQLNGKGADSTNAQHCCDYRRAKLAYETLQPHANRATGPHPPKRYSGIGFVLEKGLHVGIDLDDVRDPVSGAINPKAEEIVQRIGSYAEVSPSGTGIKIWTFGKLPNEAVKVVKDFCGQGTKIEMYGGGRYFAVTGSHIPGTPRAILNVQSAIDALQEEMRQAKEEQERARQAARPKQQNSQSPKATSGDWTLAEKVRRATAFIAKIPHAISGQRGHDQTLAMARQIYWGFDLPIDVAFELVQPWNQACDPPWNEDDLRRKLEEMDRLPADNSRGYKLGEKQTSRRSRPTQNQAGTGGFSAGPLGGAGPELRAVGQEDGEACINESVDDPDRLARLVLQKRFTNAAGEVAIRFHNGMFLQHDGERYAELTEDELRAEIHGVAKTEFDEANAVAVSTWAMAGAQGKAPTAIHVRRGVVSNVQDAMAARVILPSSTPSPSWLGSASNRPTPANIIACKNSLVDLTPYLERGDDPELIPHSPDWFSRNRFPYAFNLHAECPIWQSFLDHNLEGDRERIDLLGEWFGLALTPDTTKQKFLMLEGEGANGKSVICAALLALLGNDNCSAVPLEAFGERFALHVTLGKLVNIAAEVGELDRVSEGFLKSFTSGDAMLFDRKNRDPLTAAPTARLVLASNNRPRFSDRSGGLWRRMILMPLRVTIADGDPRRVRGMDKPGYWLETGEAPGILCWALEGLRRLRMRGDFTRSQVCEEALAEYRTENNPARKFLTETCKADPLRSVQCKGLYLQYVDWCKEHGNQPLADGQFGKEVRRVFPLVKIQRPRSDGERLNVYQGLSMLEWF